MVGSGDVRSVRRVWSTIARPRAVGRGAAPTCSTGSWTTSNETTAVNADQLVVALRATLCYMKEITHREMRNDSADVLRRVAAGETILVTNNGRPAAVIGPPLDDVLMQLSAQGQLRTALNSPAILRSIKRRKSDTTTSDIIADTRGRW